MGILFAVLMLIVSGWTAFAPESALPPPPPPA
jgi:hypothetical protein